MSWLKHLIYRLVCLFHLNKNEWKLLHLTIFFKNEVTLMDSNWLWQTFFVTVHQNEGQSESLTQPLLQILCTPVNCKSSVFPSGDFLLFICYFCRFCFLCFFLLCVYSSFSPQGCFLLWLLFNKFIPFLTLHLGPGSPWHTRNTWVQTESAWVPPGHSDFLPNFKRHAGWVNWWL